MPWFNELALSATIEVILSNPFSEGMSIIIYRSDLTWNKSVSTPLTVWQDVSSHLGTSSFIGHFLSTPLCFWFGIHWWSEVLKASVKGCILIRKKADVKEDSGTKGQRVATFYYPFICWFWLLDQKSIKCSMLKIIFLLVSLVPQVTTSVISVIIAILDRCFCLFLGIGTTYFSTAFRTKIYIRFRVQVRQGQLRAAHHLSDKSNENIFYWALLTFSWTLLALVIYGWK